MQAYGPSFARIYNLRWGRFAQTVGPLLLDFYEATPLGKTQPTLLDVCCGAGHLARLALERGYRVTGVDLSEAMLGYARQNNLDYVAAGQARFIQADAADFHVDEKFGLAVSIFDALNHLADISALAASFNCIYPALLPGGLFIFDLNTRLGLQRWNSIAVEDTPELMLITRGIYERTSSRATTHISGFIQREDGLYDRFEETAFNTAFDLEAVTQALEQTGFTGIYTARSQELSHPLAEPEQESRVFFIARKEP